jgi:diguanylate cyclase (GGDEF)-like protein
LVDGATRLGDLGPRASASAPPRCVTRDGKIIGWLIEEAVPAASADILAEVLVAPITCAIPLDTPVREAAQMLAKTGANAALLVREGKAMGSVGSAQIIGALGHSWDPLTGLLLSDALREWGEQSLAVGVEISVIFIDLNDFGQYNKRYSHVTGDKVLQALAERLRNAIRPGRDILVRFGGDEFAIGTRLDHKGAVEMAMLLQRDPLLVEGVPEAVRFSVGVSGGRRTHGRPSIHSPANMDDLITQASKACLALKATVKASGDPATLHGALLNALAKTGSPDTTGFDAVMSVDEDGNKQLTVMVPGPGGQPSWVESPLTGELEAAIAAALTKAMKID